MKKRYLLMSLASLAMVGATVGVATGFATDQSAIQTQAATNLGTGTKIYLQLNGNWKSGGWYAAYFFGSSSKTWAKMDEFRKGEVCSVSVPSGSWTNVIFCRMNSGKRELDWSSCWDQTKDLAPSDTENTYTIAEGAWTKGDGAWSTVDWEKSVEIEVTLNAVFSDSNSIEKLSSSTISSGDEYSAPATYRTAGYHFEGTWYTDKACTSVYSTTALNENTTLYGKFTKLVNDAYFYVIPSSTSEVAWNVYTYGSGTYDQQFGAWPGSAISNSMLGVTAGDPVVLGGVETLVYQVPYAVSANDTKVIVNDGGSNQTANLTLESKTAVFWNGYGVKDSEGNDTAGVTDLNKGKVTDLVINLKKAIDGAADHSVCNISKDEATKLVAARDALPESMASYWAGSKIKTYTGSSLETKDYVPVTDIMVQVEAIASASTNPLNNIGANSANPTVFIVAGVSVVGLVAVGGIFLLRKKKEN